MYFIVFYIFVFEAHKYCKHYQKLNIVLIQNIIIYQKFLFHFKTFLIIVGTHNKFNIILSLEIFTSYFFRIFMMIVILHATKALFLNI